MRRSKAKGKHLFTADRCQTSMSHRIPQEKIEWELVSKKKQMLWEHGLLENKKYGARLVVKSDTEVCRKKQRLQKNFNIVMSVLIKATCGDTSAP